MINIKRFLVLTLSVCLVFGMIFSMSPTVYAGYDEEAEGVMKTSQNGIDFIKSVEGFCQFPYYDYGQYTVGYGTRCPADKYSYYKENGITVEEAEELLRVFLEYTETEINTKLIDKYSLTLTQGQFDALVSFSFNVGTSWLNSNKISLLKNTITNRNSTPDEITYAFSLYCKAGGEILPGLVTRRLCEANMYINEEYSKTRDGRFGYVYYDPNGGELQYKVQGFQVGSASKPIADPVLEGKTFLGWYTNINGGEKVNALTIEHVGVTLYAKWDSEKDENENEQDTPTFDPIKITVTGQNVNIRSGPGTNYKIVGKTNSGDEFTITKIASGSGYTWGKSGDQWICLKYTDYGKEKQENESDVEIEETRSDNEETVQSDGSEADNIDEPLQNDDEDSAVEPSEPTEPAETQPIESTESTEFDVKEPTDPDATEPDAEPKESQNTKETETVTGKVKVDDILRIRSGPGTTYRIVGYLHNANKVEIYEQEIVNDMTWGRIGENKWISLNYVVLDGQEGSDNGNNDGKGDELEDEDASKTVTGIITADCLRIRKGPDTTYKTVGYLYYGNKVTIIERKVVDGKTWGKIGDGRWVSMSYVKLNESPASSDESISGEKDETLKMIIADCLRIRKGPGTNYKTVGYLYYGNRVNILEIKTVDGDRWGRIDKGWISMKYVE